MSRKEKGIPIVVYPSFFKFYEEPTTQEELQDAFDALYNFSKGNFEYEGKTRVVRGFLDAQKELIISAQIRYLKRSKKGKDNAAKRWGNQESDAIADKSDAIADKSDAIADKSDAITNTITTTTTTTIPPKGGAGGGGGFSFKDYYKRVKAAHIILKGDIKDPRDLKQTVWRCAEYGQVYSNEVARILASWKQESGDDRELMYKLQSLYSKYEPKSEFNAVLLAIALIDIPDSRSQIIINEVEAHQTEIDIYKTMLGKIEWAKSHDIGDFKKFVENRN